MKIIRPFFLLVFMVLSVFLSGCAQTPPSENQTSALDYEQSLINVCVQACQDSKIAGTNLESGPCLLNPMPQNYSLVCDIAHDPRATIDNLPENQCSNFGKGETMHFIEVSPDCKFIRKV
jgi:hypothetical protein